MLKSNIIRTSNSPWSSRIWVVPKESDASSNKKWRVVDPYPSRLHQIEMATKDISKTVFTVENGHLNNSLITLILQNSGVLMYLIICGRSLLDHINLKEVFSTSLRELFQGSNRNYCMSHTRMCETLSSEDQNYCGLLDPENHFYGYLDYRNCIQTLWESTTTTTVDYCSTSYPPLPWSRPFIQPISVISSVEMTN